MTPLPNKPTVVRSTELTDDGYEVVTETVTFTRIISVRRVDEAPSVDDERLASSETPSPVLDLSIFPHIFDTIVKFASPEALLKLRGTSKDMRDRMDSILCRHVVVDNTGTLRARYGRIWIPQPETDKRLTSTIAIDFPPPPCDEVIDVGFSYYGQSISFPTLSLFRLQGSPDKHYAYAIWCFIGGVNKLYYCPWLVSYFDQTVRHPDTPASSHPSPCWELRTHEDLLPGLESCVINIRYSSFHKRFGETNLQGLDFQRGEFGPLQHYVLFTRVEGPPSDTREWLLPPPVRPRMLNDLVRRIIHPTEMDIRLVDVNSWDHCWLNRHWSWEGRTFDEKTAPTATLEERLKWWIKAMAAQYNPYDEARQQAITNNITFLTTKQFQQELPDPYRAEMYDLIVHPWCLVRL